MPTWDLAADEENHFGPKGRYWDEGNNSLIQEWYGLVGLLWLNPPFDKIEPWAQKCSEEQSKGAKILLLVPASVGSFWYHAHIHNVATRVMFLSPRLCFDGKAPFPKDCLLAYFNKEAFTGHTNYECWRWK